MDVNEYQNLHLRLLAVENSPDRARCLATSATKNVAGLARVQAAEQTNIAIEVLVTQSAPEVWRHRLRVQACNRRIP